MFFLNPLIKYKGICRTAQATSGLFTEKVQPKLMNVTALYCTTLHYRVDCGIYKCLQRHVVFKKSGKAITQLSKLKLSLQIFQAWALN